jgi:hypothetical protein
VAAQLEPDKITGTNTEFVVGDNRFYGDYHNFGPLVGRDYHITLAAVSSLNGVTKRSFAKVSHDQHLEDSMIVFRFDNQEGSKSSAGEGHPHHHDDDHDPERSELREKEVESTQSRPDDASPSAQTGLIVAVVVVAVALIIALLIFLVLRYSLPRRMRRARRRPDTQELTASVATVDPVENGYLDNDAYTAKVADEPRTAAEYLASLTNRVWQIPRNFLEVNTEVVGRGRFGTVMRAIVHRGSSVTAVCTAQIIPNKLLEDDDRQRMLRDLDLNIRAGTHENLVSLVGLCEELETTMVVLESAELPLKQYLLDSRALATHPSYAEKTGRFATVREDIMLAIIAGVGRGAEHLASQCGIQHGRLCARLVYLVGLPDGHHLPKIGGFGLADFQRGNERLDPTRWSSPEALLGKKTEAMLMGSNKTASSSRADIWSFGCLLWEVATLGKEGM